MAPVPKLVLPAMLPAAMVKRSSPEPNFTSPTIDGAVVPDDGVIWLTWVAPVAADRSIATLLAPPAAEITPLLVTSASVPDLSRIAVALEAVPAAAALIDPLLVMLDRVAPLSIWKATLVSVALLEPAALTDPVTVAVGTLAPLPMRMPVALASLEAAATVPPIVMPLATVTLPPWPPMTSAFAAMPSYTPLPTRLPLMTRPFLFASDATAPSVIAWPLPISRAGALPNEVSDAAVVVTVLPLESVVEVAAVSSTPPATLPPICIAGPPSNRSSWVSLLVSVGSVVELKPVELIAACTTSAPPMSPLSATPTVFWPLVVMVPLIEALPLMAPARTPALLSPVTVIVPVCERLPVSAPSSAMPAEVSPWIVIVPLLVMLPVKAPAVWMPKRFDPCANGPSSTPSALESVCA